METVLFTLMSIVAVASALGVVALKNPVYSAFSLVVNLVMVAGFFAMLDAHFLAVAQIIVYAGAIMVLFVFVIMLLNLKVETLSQRQTGLSIIGLVVGALFLALVVPIVEHAFRDFAVAQPSVEGTVKSVGHLLYSEYLYPFEIASVLIIAAIVGAVMLAKRAGGVEAALGQQIPTQGTGRGPESGAGASVQGRE